VTHLPNSWQEDEVRISGNTKIEQVAKPPREHHLRDPPLQRETP